MRSNSILASPFKVWMSLTASSIMMLLADNTASAFSFDGRLINNLPKWLPSIFPNPFQKMNEENEETYLKFLDQRYNRLHDGISSAQPGASIKSAHIMGGVLAGLSTSADPIPVAPPAPRALRASERPDACAPVPFVRAAAVVYAVSMLRAAGSLLSQLLFARRIRQTKNLASSVAVGARTPLQVFLRHVT